MLLSSGGLIPLHNACSFGHADVVTLLLKHGADPNSRDNWNFTPLHEAAIKGKVDVCISKSKPSPCVYVCNVKELTKEQKSGKGPFYLLRATSL